MQTTSWLVRRTLHGGQEEYKAFHRRLDAAADRRRRLDAAVNSANESAAAIVAAEAEATQLNDTVTFPSLQSYGVFVSYNLNCVP